MEPVEIIMFAMRDAVGAPIASFTLDAADKVTMFAHEPLRESLEGYQINPKHLVTIGEAMQIIIEARAELERIGDAEDESVNHELIIDAFSLSPQ